MIAEIKRRRDTSNPTKQMQTKIVLIFTLLLLAAGGGRPGKIPAKLSIDRSFHRPLEFQVQEDGADVVLRTIVYAGLGGYEKGKVLSDRRRTLTAEEIARVRAALAAVAGSSPSDPMPAGGRDGSIWQFKEGRSWTRTIKIWTPQSESWLRDTKPVFEFGLLLWRLGKIEEPEKNLY